MAPRVELHGDDEPRKPNNADLAKRLATHELFVFPANPTTKRPMVKWGTKSTTDPGRIAEWWRSWPGALPAIDLGKSGLFVLDADRHDADTDGVAAAKSLFERYGHSDGAPVVRTPGKGLHYYFRQPADTLGNREGELPDGINARGKGGFTIAPGAAFANKRYVPDPNSPDLLKSLRAGTLPAVPKWLAAILRAGKDQKPKGAETFTAPVGPRELAYGKAALERCAEELAECPEGGRNIRANAIAYHIGRMVGRNWIGQDEAWKALLAAALDCGLDSDEAAATLRSGLEAGMDHPHPDLPPDRLPGGVALEDFYAFMPTHQYIFAPCRSLWPAGSVNSRLPPVALIDANGMPRRDKKGEPVVLPASAWLDRNRAVELMTWAPGLPMLIKDRLIAEGGWIEREGTAVFNLYRPPPPPSGHAAKAGPWIEHVQRIYPDDADHLIHWFAQRVQHPEIKINHALVLGGKPGVGKDTLIEPVKRAVGAWNFVEISPKSILERPFNGFARATILRVSEARDLGDANRFKLYDHMKVYLAAPPDVLRVDEKNIPAHGIFNCVGVIITTNYKTDGIYLPPDDRRHYVAWSDLASEDFELDYWSRLWGWYEAGGYGHVAVYLAGLDLTSFDAKAPPPKTATFWAIADANRAPEDAELADLLDAMGNPDATTLDEVRRLGGDMSHEFKAWLDDRKNRRVIPHRFEQCGYVPVRNDTAKDGLWVVEKKRQAIYVRSVLPKTEQLRAARTLTSDNP